MAATASLAASGGAMAATRQPDLSRLTPDQRARYEAMRARMMRAFAFERISVAGSEALARWEMLKAAGGAPAVIIGGDGDLERLADQFSMDDPAVSGTTVGLPLRSVPTILADAANLRFPACLPNWNNGCSTLPAGSWPTNVSANQAMELTVATNMLTRRPLERAWIVRVPAATDSEIPAHLRWGGWNVCPPPEHHVAALRSWRERFGAELVGINGDTLNVRVARRPASREEAIALAREHYCYAPDIVEQGAGTLADLAALLMISDWWFFWWD